MASTLNVESPIGASSSGDDKRITLDQLKEHTTRDSLWLLIHGKVYDVTKFRDEHPGGDEVLVEEAGHDATEAFDDIGHSPEADSIMEKILIGEFKGESKKKAAPAARATAGQTASTGGFPIWVIPAGFAVVYLAWRVFVA
ncbi:putative cytochrome b5 [Kockovaella imperatae]|uniref:Putative cytochrome b5 n=1 Tax=Kockovaella imperatae TaxID=4999 RepID=A0A1Y1UED0_9TREE|nr:putative cytochrome b5 [Kockovaella imperatae]ORX36403.1 putative cytochrome b5 [Kockovaella imperatae]